MKSLPNLAVNRTEIGAAPSSPASAAGYLKRSASREVPSG
jgi:hypothetical protein